MLIFVVLFKKKIDIYEKEEKNVLSNSVIYSIYMNIVKFLINSEGLKML